MGEFGALKWRRPILLHSGARYYKLKRCAIARSDTGFFVDVHYLAFRYGTALIRVGVVFVFVYICRSRQVTLCLCECNARIGLGAFLAVTPPSEVC